MPSRGIAVIPDSEQRASSLRLQLEDVYVGERQVAEESINSIRFEQNGLWHWFIMPVVFFIVAWVRMKKFVYRRWFGVSPSANSLWYDGLGDLTRTVKVHASKWRSMDALYNYYERYYPNRHSISSLTDLLWVGRFGNAKAVRNRFRIVRRWVTASLLELGRKQEEPIRVVSIACGSAQAVIEGVSEAIRQGVLVQVLLIDQDQESLDYALDLARQAGVAELVKVTKMNVFRAGSRLKSFAPDIVEMVGLADYFDDKTLTRYLTQIRENVPDGARFITANIVDSPKLFHKVEKAFLHTVADWPPMIYRTPSGFARVVADAGFSNVVSISEPMGIYSLVEANKAGVV